jgi:GTP:adenosylcobinamide-phosphate guanylyltransferase
MTSSVSVIVLAGRRADRPEPLADAHNVSDKCLVPVAGTALIDHVLRTLSSSPHIGHILVSINDPALLDALPLSGPLVRDGRVKTIKASGNLADSVLAASAQLPFPILITTADNVLLTHDAIATMIDQCTADRADAAAAFARRADILAAHPDGQRRFYGFRDDAYSNCNCYWIGNATALKAAEIFRSGGQFAKNPFRIAVNFGLFNLIRFRFGWCTLADAFDRLSRRLSLSFRPVLFNDGSLAIDVDNERTHRVVEAILARRSFAR